MAPTITSARSIDIDLTILLAAVVYDRAEEAGVLVSLLTFAAPFTFYVGESKLYRLII